MEERTGTIPTLRSVEHAFDILEAFDSSSPALSMAEIARKTGLHKSSVYRLTHVLLSRGYLDKSPVTGKYCLGLRLVGLASNRINDVELVAEAHPLMLRLNAETALTTQLCVLDGTEVVYLDEVSATAGRRYNNMGFRGEAYCSSLGKCLLAALSGEELDWRFSGYKFVRYTPTTITSYEELKAQLREVRIQGYAMNRAEQNELLSSVACPIYDYTGNIIAAISLGAASYLFIPETIEKILPHLRWYAMMISKRMGYAVDITL